MSENIASQILNSKTVEEIRKDIEKYTGIVMTDSAIIHLRNKFKTELNDLDSHENYLPLILEEYDNFAISNLNQEQISHQKVMEKYATEGESTLEGATRYYKLYNTYFEWNELHRLEHPERENKIEKVAYNIINNLAKIQVDTRKPYGEVRYVLTCIEENSKQLVITCYRYDKYHIRIITAWEE